MAQPPLSNQDLASLATNELLILKAQQQQLQAAQALIAQIIGTLTISANGPATGDLGGNYPSPTVLKLNGTPLANPLSPTNGQVLQWNGSAWVPTTIGGSSPGGAAGGDLSSTYPNPTVSSINGTPLATLSGLTTNQVLSWNGSAWVNQNVKQIQGQPIGTLSSLSQYQVLSWNGSAFVNQTTVVNSISALRNVPSSAGQVQVLGFSTPNDGGGGLFVWIASSAYSNDDVGISISSSVSTGGRWFREGFVSLLNPSGTGYTSANFKVNPKWFGAKGDGATDDTTALQKASAIAYLISQSVNDTVTPGTPTLVSLEFPPGEYLISSTIDLPSYMKMEGSGVSTITGSTNTFPLIRTGCAWCIIDGMTFNGGLNSIALYGVLDPYLSSYGVAGAYNPTAFGNVPFLINNCNFNYPAGPAIWQDCSPLSSVSSASNGQSVSSTTYHVNTTTGWASSGTFSVLLSDRTTVINVNYTGTTSTTFTGCSVSSGTGTLATGNLIFSGSNYRTFQHALKVTNFWFAGPCFYWGGGDTVEFISGHMAWDFTNAPVSGDGFPLGLLNSGDTCYLQSITAFGGGTQPVRSSIFVGSSLFTLAHCAFAQNDTFCFARQRTIANTYQGAANVAISIPGSLEEGQLLMSIRSTNLTSAFGAFFAEIYERMPELIDISADCNNGDFLGTQGIWFDQGSINLDTILDQSVTGTYISIGGPQLPISTRIWRGWDPGASQLPSCSIGYEITDWFYHLINRPSTTGFPQFQENIFNTATASGYYSFTGGTTTTDSSTGYALTLYTGTASSTSGQGGFQITPSQLIPSGLSAGVYCFSFYFRANWSGILTTSFYNSGSNYSYIPFYNSGNSYQRIEIPFYYNPSASDFFGIACTTNYVTPATTVAWTPNTLYTSAGTNTSNNSPQVTNGGKVYVCVHTGTSAASGGPTGTGSNISDGSTGLVWNYVGPATSASFTPATAAGLWMLNKGTRAAPYVFPSNQDSNIQFNYIPNIYYGTAAPTSTTDTYKVGDVIINTNPSSNSVYAWSCVSAGSPGTWQPVYSNVSGTIKADTLNSYTSNGTITIAPNVAATSTALTVKNNGTSLTAGGKLTSWNNNGTEVAYIDYAGNVNTDGSFNLLTGSGALAQTATTSPVVVEGNSSATPYLVTNTAYTTGHWSATDLANGTSNVGAAWTKVGTVPYNYVAGTVGPFTASTNYYTQSSSGPISALQTGPWTVVMIINYSTGDTLTNAFYLSQSGSYFSLQNYYGLTANFSGGSITATGGYSSFIAGQPNILMVGVDGSGNSFIKLNNTTVVQGSGIHGGNTGTATLGVYYTGGLAALASKVLEVYCGTDVPSVANFNSLYTTINAKLTNTNNRGIANVLDNQTAQTAGEIVSFRSGGTELANIDWAGNIQANHFRSVNLTSNTMSVSGSTGFTSPSITGNDARGVITSTGGSSISVTAGTTVLTVTFANPYPNGTTPIAIIQPNNQNSIGLSGNFYATCTNTQMSIIAGSGFTTTAVSYILSYMVIG